MCREIDGEIVADGVRRGIFASRDVAAATCTVRAIFDGLMMQWLAEADPEASFPAYRDRCEREILTYLTGSAEAQPDAVESAAS